MSEFEKLIVSIHRASTVLSRDAERIIMKKYGFSYSQFKLIWVLLRNNDGVNQATIAEWLNQTPAAVSRQIKHLNQQELVSIVVSKQSKRDNVVRLTPKGRMLARDVMKQLESQQAEYFSELDDTQKIKLCYQLEAIFKNVCHKK